MSATFAWERGSRGHAPSIYHDHVPASAKGKHGRIVTEHPLKPEERSLPLATLVERYPAPPPPPEQPKVKL